MAWIARRTDAGGPLAANGEVTALQTDANGATATRLTVAMVFTEEIP